MSDLLISNLEAFSKQPYNISYMGRVIECKRYLSYNSWFYEWRDLEGRERNCLHLDTTFSHEQVAYKGIQSVYNYFNGDPDKSFLL
jgi:hypothetical protein